MENVNNNTQTDGRQRLLIQVLVPACRALSQADTGFSWLNGYCILNCRLVADDVVISGEVRIGEHLAENPDLITSLTDALDTTATLAGMDLTSTLRGLCRLPIDAPDQAPALALLTKLRSMLEAHQPIDLGRPYEHALDSLNPCVLAEMLAEQASACLFAVAQIALTDVHQGQAHAAWQKWRQGLVPVLPKKEVAQTS